MRFPLYKKRDEIIQTIPGFYCEVFQNHSDLSEYMQKEDIEIMEFCSYIDVEENDDTSSFKIIFNFKENPFFTDKQLVKVIQYDPLRSISATEIHWNKGKMPKRLSDKSIIKLYYIEDDSESPLSFLVWLTKDSDDEEIADIIKTDIYAHPLEFFMDMEEDDGEEEEEDVDQDDN